MLGLFVVSPLLWCLTGKEKAPEPMERFQVCLGSRVLVPTCVHVKMLHFPEARVLLEGLPSVIPSEASIYGV